MKKLIIGFTIYSLTLNTIFAEFVVGPSTGAVFGPQPSTGLDLDLEDFTKNFKSSKDDAEYLQKQSALMDQANDGKLSCSYDKNVLDTLNLQAGVNRLEMLEDTVPSLDNPNLATAVVAPDLSESVNMYVAVEALYASNATANEADNNARNARYKQVCNAEEIAKMAKGELQLVSQVCIIHQLVTHITNLYSDSDMLFQRSVELSAVLNRAMVENVAREKDIEKQSQKNIEVAKELKKVLDTLKQDREAQKKAEEDLKNAEKQLAAAQAIPCVQICSEGEGEGEESCTEDCSARDAAVKAATAVLDAAKKAKEKADAKVKATITKLVEYLKEKMGVETKAILSMLSGTIKGDADGKSVHFKADGKEFTLVDADKAIQEMAGGKTYHGHWGRFLDEKYGDNKPAEYTSGQIRISNPDDPKTADQQEFLDKIAEGETNNYFNILSSHLEDDKEGKERKPNVMGIPMDVSSPALTGTSSNNFSPDQVLLKFAEMGESGVDNLATIAMAIGEYSATAGERKIKQLESMKTPASRMAKISEKIDEAKRLNAKVREMAMKNLCYLDQILGQYRKTYEIAMAEQKAKSAGKEIDAFLKYIYEFKTEPYHKKLAHGYESTEQLDVILADFEKRIHGFLVRFQKK